MNTRLQVEHPITEEVIGCRPGKRTDQGGRRMSRSISDNKRYATAWPCYRMPYLCGRYRNRISCRLRVSSSRLTEPNGIGVRIDSYVYEGYEIPIYYDPMIGKLIVWATNRQYAIERMRRVLHEYKIDRSENQYQLSACRIMDTPDFVEGHYDTGFIAKNSGTICSIRYVSAAPANIPRILP